MSRKILIVDDDPDAVLLLETRLQSEGYDTMTASNGVDAILTIAQGRIPDLILLDVMMPEMSGYDLVKKLKHESDAAKHVPIIILSGKKAMKQFFDEWDISGFLSKPFDSSELIALIEKTLESSTTVRSAQVETVAEEAVEEKAAAPAETSGDSRKALVVAIEDYIVDKIKGFLEPKGWVVVGMTDDRKAVAEASTIDPELVFCQYVEDKSKMNAEDLQAKVKEARGTKPFKFIPFCRRDLRTDASRVLKTTSVIGYSKAEELIQEVAKYI